jgi:hypothetical protein
MKHFHVSGVAGSFSLSDVIDMVQDQEMSGDEEIRLIETARAMEFSDGAYFPWIGRVICVKEGAV